MHSFQLSCFFLQCDGYALTSEASSSRPFVKTEPPSPISGDCSFAYATDMAEERGRNPGRIIELPF
jgi:hypothetical protein